MTTRCRVVVAAAEVSRHQTITLAVIGPATVFATERGSVARAVDYRDGLLPSTHKGDTARRRPCDPVTRGQAASPAPPFESFRVTVKICIVSDSHDRADPLLSAVQAAQREGAEVAIHCGDVIGAHTLRPLLALGMAVHVVHGNNLGDQFALANLAAASQGRLTYHGGDATLLLAGRRVFVTHYPHYARGMACTGDYDLVCCGHSHVASVVAQTDIRGGQTWLVNPGTVAGIGAPASWILGDLQALTFEVRGT